MRNTPFLLVAVPIFALAGAACEPAEEEQEPAAEEAATTEADVEAIRALLDDFVAAENAGDVERILALTTDDGWASPPGEPPIVGNEAWRSWWESTFGQVDIQGAVSDVEIQAFGDWGFVRGIWNVTATPKSGGEPQQNDYSFILVVRRENGAWKEARAVWNTNAPPPTP